jgi:hypothetical protein
MDFTLPAALLYGFGAMLLILGGLRAYHLGWKRKVELDAEAQAGGGADADADADADAGEGAAGSDGDGAPGRRDAGWRRRDGGGYKRHLVWGLLWMGMGLFLIVTTLLKRG